MSGKEKRMVVCEQASVNCGECLHRLPHKMTNWCTPVLGCSCECKPVEELPESETLAALKKAARVLEDEVGRLIEAFVMRFGVGVHFEETTARDWAGIVRAQCVKLRVELDDFGEGMEGKTTNEHE